MSPEDDWEPPPSGSQRWIARHVVALQITLACLAVFSVALLVLMVRSDGWGIGSIGRVFTTLVFLTLVWVARDTARHVDDFDRRRPRGRDLPDEG